MKKLFLIVISLSLILISCASKEVPEETEELPVAEESVLETPVSEPQVDSALQVFVDEEPDIVSIVEEPDPAAYFEDQTVLEEYLRSISSLSDDDVVIIPPQVFEEDKDQIFVIINDLATIMKNKKFDAWAAYLTPDSYEYWSNRHNLLELSKTLFPTGLNRLNNIREYFEQFFIPARRGRVVDEIRYVTPDYVKVVQYKNNTDIIYYFFERIDGEWKLRLDTL